MLNYGSMFYSDLTKYDRLQENLDTINAERGMWSNRYLSVREGFPFQSSCWFTGEKPLLWQVITELIYYAILMSFLISERKMIRWLKDDMIAAINEGKRKNGRDLKKKEAGSEYLTTCQPLFRPTLGQRHDTGHLPCFGKTCITDYSLSKSLLKQYNVCTQKIVWINWMSQYHYNYMEMELLLIFNDWTLR